MDTSEQYIKMCDCPAVQGQWKPKIGDWIFRNYEGKSGFPKDIEEEIWPEKDKFKEIQILSYLPSISGYFVTKNTDGESRTFTEEEYLKNGFIWLPRQDQIQEMFGNVSNLRYYSDLIEGFFCFTQTKYGHEFNSFERLWLAFYMCERHGKVWDGKEWLKKR